MLKAKQKLNEPTDRVPNPNVIAIYNSRKCDCWDVHVEDIKVAVSKQQ